MVWTVENKRKQHRREGESSVRNPQTKKNTEREREKVEEEGERAATAARASTAAALYGASESRE